jgi:hypothetical protein
LGGYANGRRSPALAALRPDAVKIPPKFRNTFPGTPAGGD